MIDKNASRIPIWLLWGRSSNNLVTLLAVTLAHKRAWSYRKLLLESGDFVTVRIEQSEANHLYNPQLDALWEKSYGAEFLGQTIGTATQLLRRERDEFKGAFGDLWRAAALVFTENDTVALKEVMRRLRDIYMQL